MRQSLKRTVSLAVLASARTEQDHHEDLGCSIQGPTARKVRRALAPLKKILRSTGLEAALPQARDLIRGLDESEPYSSLCVSRTRRLGRRVLRPDVLYPEAARLRPRVLHVRVGDLGFDLPLGKGDWLPIADLLAALNRGATTGELRSMSRTPVAAELLTALREGRCLTRATDPIRAPVPGATFIGHNTILVATRRARVLIDPYFRPASIVDLPQYQPMQPRDLGHIDAVLITHTHGDHFHLGSLLQLPRETPILVPAIERESVFSTDCVLRLHQLGFKRVEALRWGEERVFGDATVRALPFFGEQPTGGEGVHPGLFNEGNTWLIRTPDLSVASFADAGRDVRGDMREVCDAVHREAPVDILFCGIRGFRLRPLAFGFTTLEAYLVNVPVDALIEPVHLMADPDEALDYGARLGARYVVPCADGGAPWYWREGMGPRYPGYPGHPVSGASGLDENPDADPYPERLLDAVHGKAPEHPAPLVLRPGESFRWRGGARTPSRSQHEGFTWPFGSLPTTGASV